MRWEWSLWAQWSRPGPPGRAWLLCWARRRPRRWWRWGRRECRSGWGSSPLTSQTGSHTRGGSNYLATHQSQFYHSLLSLSCRKWNGWNMFLAAVTRLQAANIKCDKISRKTHDYTVRDTQRLRWEYVKISQSHKMPTHSPVDKLASIVFCLCPRTLNCGRLTSPDTWTLLRPSFHLYLMSAMV